LCSKKVKDFIEHKVIADLILGMTIFLCVQIFAELAFDSQIQANEGAA
jgi:TRAP-type C4-dicarboxylate transport system permease small subunit